MGTERGKTCKGKQDGEQTEVRCGKWSLAGKRQSKDMQRGRWRGIEREVRLGKESLEEKRQRSKT